MDLPLIRTVRSVCALDCPDACSLQVTIRDGRVTHVAGTADHPVTRGFACAKTARYPERQEHPDRLLVPYRRCGAKGSGKFEPVSWETAISEIADRLKNILATSGPQSILPYCYSGTMGMAEGKHALALFRALGALELDQTICATTGSAAWELSYGPDKQGTDPEEIIHSRAIILWGINALRSNSHLVPFLTEARRRGAQILHIDPYRNETSRFADEHWQIRVGTDAALALAMANTIFQNGWQDESYLSECASGVEEFRAAAQDWTLERAADVCGLPIDRLRAWTERYATSESSFIRVGYGMTRNEGGGNALRAITLLPAISGAWRRRGGGAMLSTSGGFPLNRQRLGAAHLLRPGTRVVNMNRLGDELNRVDEPINSLIVFNSNPAAVAPDSNRVRAGLRREDLFTIVLEHFQTDTADYADYLLPATTFLEHPDLYTSYGHYHLQWAEAIVPARGECRTNTQIFAAIGRQLDLTEPSLFWSAEELTRELLATDHPALAGITLEELKKAGSIKLRLAEPFLPYAGGSHHEDAKVKFAPPPEQLVFEEQTSDEFPLRLISPPGPFIVNTTMGNLESIRKMAGGQPRVLLHPNDAANIQVESGATIRLVSRQGSIERHVVVTDETLPGVVIALGQWWPKLAPDRRSLNDLTSQRLTDLGGGSTFGNTVVRAEAIPAASDVGLFKPEMVESPAIS